MGEVDRAELDRMHSQAFKVASNLYKGRGFQRRVDFGKKPALISVDLANAWTRPGNPFTCDQDKMDNEIIPGVTACACVRQTICDGIADGFRTIAVKKAARCRELWLGTFLVPTPSLAMSRRSIHVSTTSTRWPKSALQQSNNTKGTLNV